MMFLPHVYCRSVCELSPERLRGLGIDSVLIDVDCTLKRYRAEKVPPETAEWLARLQSAGIGVCLVSNGVGRRIGRLAERLGVPFVAQALKPLPFGCRRAIRKMGFDRKRTAMIGDQLFADVWAGRLAGLKTILVEPIHPGEEPWFTRLKRPLEQWLVRRFLRDK